MKLPCCGVHPALVGGLLLTLAFASYGADYSSTVLSGGPLGYWRLNETTQPSAADTVAANLGTLGSSGNGFYTNSAFVGGPSAIVGEASKKSAYFAGFPTNRIYIPYKTNWNTSGSFSFEFWAKPGQTNDLVCPAASVQFTNDFRYGWLFYQGDSAMDSGNGWLFRVYYFTSSGGFGDSIASASLQLNTNSWYHVVGVFDGTKVKLYVNGTLASTTALPAGASYAANTNTTIPLSFGARANGEWGDWCFKGNIDEPAFYSRVLTDAEVLSHYQTGTNTSPATAYETIIQNANPVGYWRLDETVPSAVNSGSLGSAANGGYYYPVATGAAGPLASAFSGFSSDNKCVTLGKSGGFVEVPPLSFTGNSVTFSTWLKRSSGQSGNAVIVQSGVSTNGAGLYFNNDTQELAYTWGDNADYSSFRSYLSIPVGTWVYAAVVVTPDFAVLALDDGNLFTVVTNAMPHDSLVFDNPLSIGADFVNPTLGFVGSIDEVAVFNRALSVGELYSQYSSAVGGMAPQIFTDTTLSPALPYVGDTLLFSVDVGGTPDLSYQWRKNGTSISGATNSTYTITAAATANNGTYDVVVKNAYGSVTCSEVSVSLSSLKEPSIDADPVSRTLFVGGSLSLSVNAMGGGLSYQWMKNGSALTGETNSSFVISPVTTNDAGTYVLVVSNKVGKFTSGGAVIVVLSPASGSFESVILADSPLSWWRLDEGLYSTTAFDAMGHHDGTYSIVASLGQAGALSNDSDTAASSDGSSYIALVPYSADLNSDTCSVEAWVKNADTGILESPISSYSVTSGSGRGYGFIKTSGDQWYGITGNGDESIYYYAEMNNLESGKWTHLVMTFSDGDNAVYQDGELVAGPYAGYYKHNTSAPFLIGGIGLNTDLQSFWNGTIDEVVFYKSALTAAQVKAHYTAGLYGSNVKPVFELQPESQTLVVGSPATFIGKVGGSLPLSLQWTFNGVPISGATNRTYSISSVAYSDAGSYYLTATNPVGGIISTAAVLSVVSDPQYINLTNGLVLHLKFDGDMTDSSGRGNNGTAVGTPVFSDGKLGNALHYNTDTTNSIFNYVTLGQPDDLAFGETLNFSVAYWIHLPSGYSGSDLPFLANSLNSYGNTGFTFAPSFKGDGGWSWSLGKVGVLGDANSINDGVWHHLVHTFDRTGVANTYFDGTLVDSRPDISGGYLNTGYDVNIGQDGTGSYPVSGEADIDDVGIWNRALSPYEAKAIYLVGENYGRSFDTVGPIVTSVTLSVQRSGSKIILSWTTGTLLEATSVEGPWTVVNGATAPSYTTDASSGTKFYRVKVF